jgi:putative chitinase
MVQLATLIAAGIGPTQARSFTVPLQEAFSRFQIDTPLRQAAFVAQCAHESQLFTSLEEGLYYRTPDRICRIFRSTVPNLAVAQTLACNPKGLACHVYAGRNGNGNEASGDGWRYRGRGLIQLTGRSNYARAAAGLGRPYLEEPDVVAQPDDACLSAAWFWQAGNLNALADASRIDDITRAINGAAMAGAQERRELFHVALAAFQAAPPAPSPPSQARSDALAPAPLASPHPDTVAPTPTVSPRSRSATPAP